MDYGIIIAKMKFSIEITETLQRVVEVEADKVELCALPTAIRNAYRRMIGKCRPQEDGE